VKLTGRAVLAAPRVAAILRLTSRAGGTGGPGPRVQRFWPGR
jgi:hypothetical protein